MNFIDKELSKVIENISIDRLSSYKFNDSDNSDLILRRYIYNIQVAESFYPLLAALEISLRNRLYMAIVNLKGENWLLNEITSSNMLLVNERKVLLDVYNKIKCKYTNISETSIIAELTFGFWINLCKKVYKNTLWDKQGFFDKIFPDFDKHFNSPTWDKTKVVFPILKEILRLRNRIFHHEIIINNKNGIENMYEQTKRILYSLSEEYAKIFETSFRFSDVIKQKP